jgi:hypothetical protein
MTKIPADAVLRLREALYGQIGDVAEDLATATRQPAREAREEWTEPVARFDRTRALLDEIGWNERDPERSAEVDVDQHRQVIVEALSAQLESEHHLMSERGPAAAQQRHRARNYARTIEALMAAVGLDGGQ